MPLPKSVGKCVGQDINPKALLYKHLIVAWEKSFHQWRVYNLFTYIQINFLNNVSGFHMLLAYIIST